MSDLNIVPYDPKRHLEPWKSSILSKDFMSAPGTVMGTVTISFILGVILGLMLTCVFMGLEWIVGWETAFPTAFLWIAGICCATAFPFVGAELTDTIDRDSVRKIRERVQTFVRSKFPGDKSDEQVTLALTMTDELVIEGSASRPLLLRLDSILIELDKALKEIGPRKPAIDEATEVASDAISRILAQHREKLERDAIGVDTLARLRSSCEATIEGVADGGAAIASTAPSARIAHLVATAEKALDIDPDLVDDTGASVADLVRNHVPRLLRRHAVAKQTASGAEVNAVDDALDEGVESIRVSIQKALANLHDDARGALDREITFLALRRREADAFDAATPDTAEVPVN